MKNFSILFLLTILLIPFFSLDCFSQDAGETGIFSLADKNKSFLYLSPFYLNKSYSLRAGVEFQRNRSAFFGGLIHGNEIHDNSLYAGVEFGYKYSFTPYRRVNFHLKSACKFSFRQSEVKNENSSDRKIGIGPGIDFKIKRLTIGAGVILGYEDRRSINNGSIYPERKKFMFYDLEWINLKYRLK